jgi:hypothetical protein
MRLKGSKVKLNHVGRRKEILRTGYRLGWASILVLATLGSGLEPARAGHQRVDPSGALWRSCHCSCR